MSAPVRVWRRRAPSLPLAHDAPQPMLMGKTTSVPTEPGWVQEPKYDGWRVCARSDEEGRLWLWTRHGRRYRASQLPYLADELATLPRHTTLDGELVALSARGERVTQRREQVGVALGLSAPHEPSERRPALYFVAFDVLVADSQPVTAQPWQQRRALLEHLVGQQQYLRTTEVWEPCAERHQRLVDDGWEGSVFKRADSRYFAGRRRDCWRKLLGPATACEHAA